MYYTFNSATCFPTSKCKVYVKGLVENHIAVHSRFYWVLYDEMKESLVPLQITQWISN